MHIRSQEHYKTQGELSPLALYLIRTARIVIVVVLLLVCGRTIPASPEKHLAASIDVHETRIVRSSMQTVDGAIWPDSSVYARWPDKILYLDAELRVRHARAFDTGELYSADAYGYADYSRTGAAITVFAGNGEKTFEHQTSAYPRLPDSPNWIFLYTGDQAGIAFLNRRQGNLQGGYLQFASLITAGVVLDDEESAVLGMLDGSIEKFALPENKSTWRIKPPAGRLAVIKSLAAIPARSKAQGVFAVSGSEPEMYTLIDHDGRVRWSRKSDGDLRTHIMTFASDRFAAAHTARALVIMDLDTGDERFRLTPPFAATEGRVTWVSFAASPRTDSLYAAISQNAHTAIYHLTANGRIRDFKVIDSPWAELTLSEDASALAIAAQDAIFFYRNAEGSP
jgi:hypothetical protein